MINCTDNEIKISKLLDGELNKSDYAELFQHLASCDDCRIFFHQMQGLKNSLENMDQASVEPAQMVAPAPSRPPLLHFWEQKITVRAPIIAFGLVLIAAVMILFFARPKSETIYCGRMATIVVSADSSITNFK